MENLCTICNRTYASKQSRWNHMKKFHKNSNDKSVVDNIQQVVSKNTTSTLLDDNTVCKFCNKKLCDRMYRWKHEKICKSKIENDLKEKFQELEKKNELIEKQNNTMVKEMEELKKLIQKSFKIHPKKLQKINNQLNNEGIINITNNINIVQLGHENLSEILSDKEKITILNKRANGLREIVDLVHISNKYSQFKNVYITNLQNTIGYKYDNKTNTFIAVNKSELLDDIIDCRMYDIETFYNNLEYKLDVSTAKIVKHFIERMNDGKDNLKGVKKEELKLLLYNSRDKILSKKEIEI